MSKQDITCEKAQSLLSHFYDGQLDVDQCRAVSDHLEACSACTAILNDYERLSIVNSGVKVSEAPADLWTKLQHKLDAPTNPPAPLVVTTIDRRSSTSSWMVTAAIVIVIGLGMVAVSTRLTNTHLPDHQHEIVSIDFDNYLETYSSSPEQAVQDLFNGYPKQFVSVEAATKRVGYRPVVANSLPSGYSVESIQLLKMPCCECVKTICRNEAGAPFVVFEHDAEQAMWFGDRQSQQCDCGGKPTTVFEFENQIAATWRVGKRSVSIIGLQDVAEITKLMPYLGHDPTAS